MSTRWGGAAEVGAESTHKDVDSPPANSDGSGARGRPGSGCHALLLAAGGLPGALLLPDVPLVRGQPRGRRQLRLDAQRLRSAGNSCIQALLNTCKPCHCGQCVLLFTVPDLPAAGCRLDICMSLIRPLAFRISC